MAVELWIIIWVLILAAIPILVWRDCKKSQRKHDAWIAGMTPEERKIYEEEQYHQWYVENDPR